MVTPGVAAVVCVMVMELEFAVALVTQLSEDVMTQVTTPLLATAAAYVDELVPTFTPFTFH